MSYEFRPLQVAKTLLARSDDGLQRSDNEVATKDGELFRLLWTDDEMTLQSPYGAAKFSNEELKDIDADPLWESAFGICSHMEEDHADTFEVFLKSVGAQWDDGELSMPWVERRGFFLSSQGRYAWVPFTRDCNTPNLVRKTLIQMLKEARS